LPIYNGDDKLSKRVTVTCKIKNTDKRVFERSLDNMMRLMSGEIIKDKSTSSYRIRTDAIGPFSVNVTLKNGQITVEGYEDSNTVSNAQRMVENFYIATEIEEEFNTPMELDKEGNILLSVEV